MYHMSQVMREAIPKLEPSDGGIIVHARAVEINPMAASRPFWQLLDNPASTLCRHSSRNRTCSGLESCNRRSKTRQAI